MWRRMKKMPLRVNDDWFNGLIIIGLIFNGLIIVGFPGELE